jgi:Serine-threonine protein kinase 19
VKVTIKKRKPSTSSVVKRKIGVSRGLPAPFLLTRRDERVEIGNNNRIEGIDHHDNNDNNDDSDNNDSNDIPCDTLLAMQSIIQAQQCLFIPLQVGSEIVPSVLVSQLYQKLQNPIEGDSIVTKEVLALIRTNKLRRLVSLDTSVVTLMHTKDYVRAVWDSHQACSTADKTCSTFILEITTWFLAILPKWTAETMSRKDMSSHWMSKKYNFQKVLDILVTKMQLLISNRNQDTFLLWLPNWGLVLQGLQQAQSNIILRIKRSMHKEVSEQSIRNSSLPGGMSAYFVTQTLIANGKITVHKKPTGSFFRLSS